MSFIQNQVPSSAKSGSALSVSVALFSNKLNMVSNIWAEISYVVFKCAFLTIFQRFFYTCILCNRIFDPNVCILLYTDLCTHLNLVLILKTKQTANPELCV